MSIFLGLPQATLGLSLLLGLRHGLDPDHVALIDNLTFRLSGERSRWAPWVGTFFALGHSLSVAAVAIGVSLAAVRLPLPGWIAEAVEWGVIALLILVGAMNLRALRRPGVYTPAGWRQGMIPRPLRSASSPLAILAIGVIFGLVFDTATQAAAWGLAAASQDGLRGVILVCAVFAAGMTFTDTLDSRIVAGLLADGGDAERVRRYRRGVGWIIVALSFAMAGYALAGKLTGAQDLPDTVMSGVGMAMALAVIAFLAVGRSRPRAA
jgi:high-affinity nickel-transport protein